MQTTGTCPRCRGVHPETLGCDPDRGRWSEILRLRSLLARAVMVVDTVRSLNGSCTCHDCVKTRAALDAFLASAAAERVPNEPRGADHA